MNSYAFLTINKQAGYEKNRWTVIAIHMHVRVLMQNKLRKKQYKNYNTMSVCVRQMDKHALLQLKV